MDMLTIATQLMGMQMQQIRQTAQVAAVKAAAQADQSVVNMLTEAADVTRSVPVSQTKGTVLDILA